MLAQLGWMCSHPQRQSRPAQQCTTQSDTGAQPKHQPSCCRISKPLLTLDPRGFLASGRRPATHHAQKQKVYPVHSPQAVVPHLATPLVEPARGRPASHSPCTKPSVCHDAPSSFTATPSAASRTPIKAQGAGRPERLTVHKAECLPVCHQVPRALSNLTQQRHIALCLWLLLQVGVVVTDHCSTQSNSGSTHIHRQNSGCCLARRCPPFLVLFSQQDLYTPAAGVLHAPFTLANTNTHHGPPAAGPGPALQ